MLELGQVSFTRRRLLGTTAAAGLATLATTGVGPAAAAARHSQVEWPITEPYGPLRGGRFLPGRTRASVDPLVRYQWSEVEHDDDLQVYQLLPVDVVPETPGAFADPSSATSRSCDVRVGGVGSLRFDFGHESPAWLEIDVEDFSGSIEMSVSEYNRPARVNPGPAHPVKTLSPERVGHTFRLKPNDEYYEGVRFGWVHVRTFDRPWRITAVRLVCQAKPANYVGSFSCDDERLDEIWYAGAYTARAAFQKDYFGAILVDRGDRYSWSGDCYPHQAAAMAVFGNDDFVRDNLERTSGISNGIEIYSVYWVLSYLDYYLNSGDAELFRRFVGNARQKIDHADTLFDDPVNTFYGWDERLGAGFEAPNRPETKNVFRATLVQAAYRFADALDTIDEVALADSYRALADRRRDDLRSSPDWHGEWGVHALAEAVNGRVTEPGELAEVYDHGFNDRLARLSFSPFNQYFIIQAMSRMGHVDEALQTVHDNWGAQLDYGGTTYFEVFRPSWVDVLEANDPVPNSQSGWTSLAHPWGAGVTAWLTSDVLGIRPTTPGFARFDFAPRPGRSLGFVAGEVPTPLGTITGRYDARSGHGSLTVPPGSRARVSLVEPDRDIKHVKVRLRRLDSTWHRVDSSSMPSLADGEVVIDDLGPGEWDVRVTFRGRRSTIVPDPMTYPLQARGLDRSTSGDWGGRYGRDGYVLFNYEGSGRHRSHLPSYVTSVQPYQVGGWSSSLNTQWVSSTDDRRALAPGPDNDVPRTAGVVYSATPDAGGMTMVFDVEATPAAPFELSLYFVDWDSAARRVAVELFDLRTRELLTPVQLVDAFHDGAYLRLTCDRAVRVRVAHVLGDNAVLSGMFFDPIRA